MTEQIKTKANPSHNGLYNVIVGILLVIGILVTLFGVYTTVYYGADIDESYALTMALRIATGDRMLIDMWEPHQLSAVVYAPLVFAYKAVTGTMTGALVFMRWAGVFIQLCISVFVYRVFMKRSSKSFAFFLALLYMNFTPKHIQSPDFTSLFYWAMMLYILFFLKYYVKKTTGCIIGLGISMSVMVLCYPLCVLVFVYTFLVLWKEKKSWVFFVVCALLGMSFLVYLACRGNLLEALSSISYMLMDESHKQSLALLWKTHIKDCISLGMITVAIIALAQVGRPVLDKKRTKGYIFLTVILAAQSIWSIVQFHTITKVNFMVVYPIVFDLFLIGLYAISFLRDKNTEREELSEREEKTEGVDPKESVESKETIVCIFANILSVFAILTMSNVPFSYSVSFLMPCILVLFAYMYNLLKPHKICLGIGMTCLVLFLGQICVSRITLVRFTATQRKNIFENFTTVDHGTLKGVKLGDFDYSEYEQKTRLLESYVGKSDRLLYVGADMFLYNSLDGKQIGTGNTISTPVFEKQFVKYYELHPQRIPTVVFVDRDYVTDFSVLIEKEPLKGFLEEYFGLENAIYDGPLIIYKR